MYSYLMAENRTHLPAITICGADGVIFRDILSGEKTGYRTVNSGSARIELYDNFHKLIAVFWLPLVPSARVKLLIYPDAVRFTPMR